MVSIGNEMIDIWLMRYIFECRIELFTVLVKNVKLK